MENFDCCKFGIDKIQREKRVADAASALLQEMGDVINELKNKKREFPSGGVVNESAQGEFFVSDRPLGKKYIAKVEFRKAAAKILQLPIAYLENPFHKNTMFCKVLKNHGVFDLFCEEVKEEKKWEEPEFYLSVGAPRETYIKAKLLVRMQSWADFYNKLDGFVANWADDRQYKYGIGIEGKEARVLIKIGYNAYLFQICVSSESRAKQMHDYFKADIEKLIQLKMI